MAKILVVDDHSPNRDFIVTLCKHLGHQHLEAADGAEALTVVRAERPQLVICDILMPTMDGYEFVRQLRTTPALAKTEVIFWTANYREPEARNLAISLGVTHILFKPCEAEVVIQTIVSTLENIVASPLSPPDEQVFDRDHLRLITNKLAEKGDELLRANQRLSLLTDLNLQLASERDPHLLLEKVCRGARELIGARHAFLCIKAKNNGESVYLFSSGLAPESAEKLLCPQIDAGIFADVMAERKSLRTTNPDGDAQAVGFPSGYPTVAHCVTAPIVSLGSVYGWLCLCNKVGADAFSEEDEHLLTIHAAQVGRIYENGSLYVMMERRNAQLQVEVEQRRTAEEMLRKSETTLLGAQSLAKIGNWEVDLRTQTRIWSQAMFRVMGCDPALGVPTLTHFFQLIHQEDREVAQSKLLATIQEGSNLDVTFRLMRPDGNIVWIESRSEIYSDAAGRPVRVLGTSQDITERKEAEQKILRLNRVYAVLSQINTLIVRVSDRSELFREATRIATQEGKFTRAWIGLFESTAPCGVNVVAASSADDQFRVKLKDRLQHMPDSVLLPLLKRIEAGQVVVFNDLRNAPPLAITDDTIDSDSLSVVMLPLSVEGRVVGLLNLHADSVGFFDSDEMKLLNELAGDIGFALNHLDNASRLDYLAFYDELTGLANLKLFRERLTASVGNGRQRSGLVLLDVERFKAINDAHGRHVGDKLLMLVGERLSRSADGKDNVSRIGADHFAMLLPGVISEEEAAQRLEASIQACFGSAFKIDNHELRVSARCGIAISPDDGSDADRLFRNAEAALKKAKSTRDPYLFYSARMNEHVAERVAMESKLRVALDLDQFVLHYQPKIDSVTRKIVSVEALIRWNDPASGLISPVHFIPLLEETGLILQVGTWALRQAFQDYQRWLSLVPEPPRIAVNVSPIQLRRKDFVEQLRALLAERPNSHGIDIEITESLIMEDIEGNIENLNEIRDLGVAISIDDFGTGYSSLAYLARLPVEIVKIDRSFITMMLRDTNIMTVVSTIITLSHSLGFKVVAEGVEEEAQANILRELGCDQMQGYLFAKPLPYGALTALITESPRPLQTPDKLNFKI
jgi:diguanylate cyclase